MNTTPIVADPTTGVVANPGFAAANNLDTTGARDTAISAAIAALPAPVDTSAAPIQPFTAWLNRGAQMLADPTQDLLLPAIGITSLDPASLVAKLVSRMEYLFGVGQGSNAIVVSLQGNSISNTQAILDAFAAAITNGSTFPSHYTGQLQINLSDGTNAAVTPSVAHQDATLDLQLPDPSNPANAGTISTISYNGGQYPCSLVYDASLTLAQSNTVNNQDQSISSVTTIGIQDHPSMSQVVAILNGSDTTTAPSVDYINVFQYFSADGVVNIDTDGHVTGHNTFEYDYPAEGVGVTNPGVIANPNASIDTIHGYHSSVVTTN